MFSNQTHTAKQDRNSTRRQKVGHEFLTEKQWKPIMNGLTN